MYSFTVNLPFVSFRLVAGRVWSWRCVEGRMHLYPVTSPMSCTTSSNTCSRLTPETDPQCTQSSALTALPGCCRNTWRQRYFMEIILKTNQYFMERFKRISWSSNQIVCFFFIVIVTKLQPIYVWLQSAAYKNF